MLTDIKREEIINNYFDDFFFKFSPTSLTNKIMHEGTKYINNILKKSEEYSHF